MNRTFQDRVFIVTGASRGIGKRIAIKLAGRGGKIVAVGRSVNDLQDTAKVIQDGNGQCLPVVADLTQPDARENVINQALATFPFIDGLVNSAGVAAHGEFESGTEDVLRKVMEINFFSAAEMIRLCVPAMQKSAHEKRQPVVMNIASLVGRFGMPGISEHSASKHALIGLTESLRVEFVRYGIDVLLAAPSIVKTDNHDAHLLRSEPVPSVDFEKGIDPDYVAEEIIKAIAGNKTESYIGRLAFWVNMGRRLGPRMLRKVLWRRFGVS
jgi:NAD(P)-dependent dehydrogenase (short-subunit alcohol dehydrogenase family)